MTISILRAKVKCPYCQFEQFVEVFDWPTWKAVYCDTTEGGCDRLFVYTIRVRLKPEIKKVEGEEYHANA